MVPGSEIGLVCLGQTSIYFERDSTVNKTLSGLLLCYKEKPTQAAVMTNQPLQCAKCSLGLIHLHNSPDGAKAAMSYSVVAHPTPLLSLALPQ